MRSKFCFWGVVVLSCLLLGSVVQAYSGKVFIYHSAISDANLGGVDSLDISVYASRPHQNGGPTPLTAGTHYALEKNGKYQGQTDAIAIDVLSSTGSTAYVLLKGSERYSIAAGSLGDPVGPDQIISSLNSYRLGKPEAPEIGDPINTGYETASAALTYSADYEYSGIDVEVLDKDNNNALPLGASLPPIKWAH